MSETFIGLVLLCTSITFISCGDGGDSKNKIDFKIVKYERQSEGCDGLREDNCAKIKFEFPRITSFENKQVMDKINNSIESLFSIAGLGDSTKPDFDAEMDRFIKEYNLFIQEFPDAYQSWFIERSGEVRLNKSDIFSIDYLEYSFTGGAHANTYITFKNYNLNNGEEIHLDEILKPGKLKDLTDIGESEFRQLKNLSPGDDLGQAGFWFENNEFYLNENFLLSDSSMVFYYNNYEITAYAFGPTELVIPYSKIKDLILEEGIISNLLK